jgi:glycosyltransferase involved in cell wall biosynthesis
MKHFELVSAIIPTHKRDVDFEKALVCMLNQTYKKLEIIVVDDNYNYPQYREKVKKIVSKYHDVILLQNSQQLGGALSRNRGIEEAKGKFIVFLDDDDLCTPDRIEKQYEYYVKNKNDKTGIVICNNKKIDLSGNLIYQHMCEILATTSKWFIPKVVIKDLGCFDDVPSEQDTLLLLKLLCRGYELLSVPEDLVVMGEHDNFSGISGLKPLNIVGSEHLRDVERQNYHYLDDAFQIREVEYCMSIKMLPKYIYNHKKLEATREMKNILSTHVFRISTIKSLLKYLFPKYFVINRHSKK